MNQQIVSRLIVLLCLVVWTANIVMIYGGITQ